jgi:A/G-specific adenine glycosylase
MTPRKFRSLVYAHYRKAGRHDLPWRKTTDPYKILVSEIMLQQTQVDRVIPYFSRFTTRFPTIRSLSKAPLGDVLRLWQGLGYNRRAKMLHECAKKVLLSHKGKMPDTYEDLLALPGIGPYTASAVMAFAYNKPLPLIETNVRAAFIHHFFPLRDTVHDSELLSLIEEVLDRKKPREWYSALMDYGSHLKRTTGNASRRSAHHVRQSKFEGSDRQVRGAILRSLAVQPRSLAMLVRDTKHAKVRVEVQLKALMKEKMVVQKKGAYWLP